MLKIFFASAYLEGFYHCHSPLLFPAPNPLNTHTHTHLSLAYSYSLQVQSRVPVLSETSLSSLLLPQLVNHSLSEVSQHFSFSL